jgi:hypothetical protein
MVFHTTQVSRLGQTDYGSLPLICLRSFFWSAEFYGGVLSDDTSRSRFRSFGFAGLVLIGGLLAVMAGPATAVLMIPRSQNWPIGGAIFWLNGAKRLTLDLQELFKSSH